MHSARSLLPALLILVGCAHAPHQPVPAQAQPPALQSQASTQPAAPWSFKDAYTKREYMVPMRDGVHLFTQVFSPRDTSHPYPFILNRTPYSVGPYGDGFPDISGTNESFAKDGFILVRQDVRGCYMSEGSFVNMTPHRDAKHAPADTDESSDTFDTIEWLLANTSNHNGKVGQWGISYPGFYSSAGMIDHHPALVAVSPQAPIADWFFDDFYHRGAFFLPHCFNFFSGFGKPRPQPTFKGSEGFKHPSPDGYQFFLELGALSNVNKRYFKGEIPFWNDIVAHPSYDDFWQARNLLPHLKNVAPAVLVVGGLFDAEDLYGAINTYQAIEHQNPGIFNTLVMGPWGHGDWGRGVGRSLGNIDFGADTSAWFQQNIQLPFFRHFLKGESLPPFPEAFMFETGANRWRTFDHWPPSARRESLLRLGPGGALAFDAPPAESSDQFLSDPAHPVPYSEIISSGMDRAYMTDDQRFASRSADVLTYRTEPLTQDITLAGPLIAQLVVSTSQTDADWVVKLIDVFPGDAPDPPTMRPGQHLGGYQMMVRSEALRGRYRNSFSHPEPFTPGAPTPVTIPLQDVLHTFQKGHRIMVQIQSTWFPIMDRNPQKYVNNIFEATDADFTPATHRVYHKSAIRVGVLPPDSN